MAVCLLVQAATGALGAIGGIWYAGALPTEMILTVYPVRSAWCWPAAGPGLGGPARLNGGRRSAIAASARGVHNGRRE
jgi:hypothetical protein